MDALASRVDKDGGEGTALKGLDGSLGRETPANRTTFLPFFLFQWKFYERAKNWGPNRGLCSREEEMGMNSWGFESCFKVCYYL